MRLLVASLLLLALPLAGCLGNPADPVDPAGATDASDAAMPVVLPEPIEDTQTVIGSADPLNFVGQPICSAPTSTCHRYPFTLTGEAKVTAALSWGIPANDFDLYYVDANGAVVASDGASPPGDSESLAETLGAGDHEVVVVAWAVAQDSFTLKVEFASLGAAPAADSDEGNQTASLR